MTGWLRSLPAQLVTLVIVLTVSLNPSTVLFLVKLADIRPSPAPGLGREAKIDSTLPEIRVYCVCVEIRVYVLCVC